jgi:hypothetical protein
VTDVQSTSRFGSGRENAGISTRQGMFMDYLFHRVRLRTKNLPEATRRCRIKRA